MPRPRYRKSLRSKKRAATSSTAAGRLQRLLHLFGKLEQRGDVRLRVGLGQRAFHLAQEQRQQIQRDELRRERLGRRHADFWAGVRVDGAFGLSRVAMLPTTLQMARLRAPFLARLAQRRQRVGGLARLRDDDDQRVAVDDEVAIAVLRAVVDFDGQAGEALDEELADQRRVPGCAARDQRRPC